MMMAPIRALALVSLLTTFLTPTTATKDPGQLEWCFNGCWDVLDMLTWDQPKEYADMDYWVSFCIYRLKVDSIYHCAQKYCSRTEFEHGRNLLNADCLQYGNHTTVPTVDELWPSQEELNALPLVDNSTIAISVDAPLNNTVVPTRAWQRLGQKTEGTFYRHWFLIKDMSWALIGFRGLVMLIGMINRVSQIIIPRKQSPTRPMRSSNFWLWIRRRLILPATFGERCQAPIGGLAGGTLPPRLESMVIGSFILLNIVFLFPGYHIFNGNIWYTTDKMQISRYIGDRTGWLAVALLPPTWVFASRNDPFLWLTGWSYSTYSKFHRWTARLACLHAVVHSIAWTLFEIWAGGGEYNSIWRERWFWAGVVATIVMSLMMGFSAYYFREKFYDLFLMTHVVLSVVFIPMVWYHLIDSDHEFDWSMWPCIAIWSVDRLLRLARTIYISVIPRFTKNVKALATYDTDGDMIRLDVTGFFPNKKIVPGHFYYMYMPGNIRGYESHPLTLCSYYKANGSPMSSTPTSPVSDFKGAKALDTEIQTAVRRLGSDSGLEEKPTHTILVRPYSGMTGRLRDQITKASAKGLTPHINILLEGPYGEKLDLSRFSDIIIIAGGAGITTAVSQSYLVLPNGQTSVQFNAADRAGR